MSEHGIDFNGHTSWQRVGTDLWWETYEKKNFDPILQKPVRAAPPRLRVDVQLPIGDCNTFSIQQLMSPTEA